MMFYDHFTDVASIVANSSYRFVISNIVPYHFYLHTTSAKLGKLWTNKIENGQKREGYKCISSKWINFSS